MLVSLPARPSAHKHAVPKHTAMSASPLIRCKGIEDKLVVRGGSIVGASGLLYSLIPHDLRSNAFILVALGSKVINEVIVVGSSGDRRDGYLWRVPVRGGGTRSRDILKLSPFPGPQGTEYRRAAGETN